MMKPENAIEVRDLKKSFKVYLDKGSQLKEKILFRSRRRYENREVLKGISFDVKKGEAVALIGHNGCGKSTTLKLLTKIIYPDSGSVEMRGRVSSLIELGAGFHPDMSGRENIFLNAAIFGLTREEIESRVDDIIEFSELEEFIDNPVRTYSSGMYMRLAFAVAINVDADILLIDEILAVGDAAFQAKCFNKLREIKSTGTTIVIVSHSLSQIEQICERSIWIHKGEIREDGAPRDVDPLYLEYMSKKTGKTDTIEKQANLQSEDKTSKDKKRYGSGEVVFTSVKLCDEGGKESRSLTCNKDCKLRVEYKAKRKITDAVIGIAIYRNDKTQVYGTNSLIDTAEPLCLEGEGWIEMQITGFPLNEGSYFLDLAFHRPDGFDYDFWKDALSFDVENPHQEVGIVSFNHKWVIVQE